MNVNDINTAPDPDAIAAHLAAEQDATDSILSGQSLIAASVLDQNPGRIMFVPGVGWHHYDGTRWYTGNGLADKRIARMIFRQAQRILADSGRLNISTDAREAMQKAANRVIDRSSEIDGVLRYIASDDRALVAVDDLNADPMLLNCTNGTLDLRTGQLHDHNPDDRITKITGCGYYPDAQATSWEKFLTEAFDGHPGLVDAMAQCFGGIGLTGTSDEHLLPILYGVAGGGKNTFCDAILEVMGDYAMPAAPDLLVQSKGAHPTEAMDLLGSRLAICSEVSQGAHMNTAAMKRLTGDRFIKARYMYRDYVTFRRSHLLVMVTNDLPVLPPSSDDGVFRRVKVIPFTNKPTEPDLLLPTRLVTESAGILRWLVDGALAYSTAGHVNWPKSVELATTQYRDRSDLYGEFLDDVTVPQVTRIIKLGTLHKEWKRWLGENAPDVSPGRIQDFIEALSKRPELDIDLGGRAKVMRDRALRIELTGDDQ